MAYISDRKVWFSCVAKLQKADRSDIRSNLANVTRAREIANNLTVVLFSRALADPICQMTF